jgi:aminoglycoside 6-adenylyltransferase
MLNRRDEKTILNLIINVAEKDEKIRAAILNGSRVSPNAKKDVFQDYDIVYLVTSVEAFVNNIWIQQFGEILIMQTPDQIDNKWPQSKNKYTYLMQFKDWNRIDLTLMHMTLFNKITNDSQSIVLLDKDNNLKLEPPSDKSYLPSPPTEKEFFNCCNEFLWVSTYVAKGIWRKELIYTKYLFEHVLRKELIKLLTWCAGINTNYQKTIGKFSKDLGKYIAPQIWKEFVQTYVGSDYNDNWIALFKMYELFDIAALQIAKIFEFSYDQNEYKNVLSYLQEIRLYKE